MTVKAALVPVGEKPRMITIEPDSDGSYLKALQKLVKGPIDAFSVLYGEQPLIWVNDNGLCQGAPNRAVFANERMAEIGYISQLDYSTTVAPGELYTVIYGDFVAMAYDRDENGDEVPRDITDAEFERVCRDFADTDSGFIATLAIKAGLVV